MVFVVLIIRMTGATLNNLSYLGEIFSSTRFPSFIYATAHKLPNQREEQCWEYNIDKLHNIEKYVCIL